MEVPISDARRRWPVVSRQAAVQPIMLTRYGRPWVVLSPVSGTLRAILDDVDAPRFSSRMGWLYLCAIARRVRARGAAVVVADRYLIAVLPT